MSLGAFFHKLEDEFKILFHRSPDAIIQISSTINYTVPLIEVAASVITPEYAPILNPILEKVRVGFAALSVTIKQSGTTPNALSIITSITNNLDLLTSAAQVKDPATQQKIVAAVNLVKAEAEQIASAIQDAQASKAAAPAPAAPAAPVIAQPAAQPVTA